jgi:hypothetical protein
MLFMILSFRMCAKQQVFEEEEKEEKGFLWRKVVRFR